MPDRRKSGRPRSGAARRPRKGDARVIRFGDGQSPSDYRLLMTACLALVAIGVVMVFSASSTTQILTDGNLAASTSFLKKTLIAVAIGMVSLGVATRINLSRVRELTPVFVIVCLIALFAVLVVGARINGSKGWFNFGPIQMQPVEFLKLALVLYGANLLADRPDRLESVKAMGPYLLLTLGACFLVFLQPDMGSAMIAVFAVAATLVAAGARFRDLGLLGAIGGMGALLLAVAVPYRRDRLLTFLHPGADPYGDGLQTIQAKIAIGSGGLSGVGIGNGVQKAFYLPEAHTDMIPAVIGEEFGFIGLVAVIALFGMVAFAGYRIALRARDAYGRILAGGLTSLILAQAGLNLMAVMGMAPLTGVPLPLVSYGNNSLVVSLVAIGLILNVGRGGYAASRARPSGRGRARPPATLRVIEGQGGQQLNTRPGRIVHGTASGSRGGDRRRRHGRARGAGPRGRRRAS